MARTHTSSRPTGVTKSTWSTNFNTHSQQRHTLRVQLVPPPPAHSSATPIDWAELDIIEEKVQVGP